MPSQHAGNMGVFIVPWPASIRHALPTRVDLLAHVPFVE
jgi:hypothetical protein